MGKIVEPSTQFLVPTPNEHINYVFDSSSTIEEYRTARYINNILRIFGNDKILRGIDAIDYSLSSNNFSLTLNSGILIQDSTLIEVINSFTQTLNNLSSTLQSSSNYYIVSYTDFQFLPVTSPPVSNPNSFNIYIGVLDTSSHILYNQDPNTTGTVITWNTNVNRSVIYAAQITDLTVHPVTVQIGSYIYNVKSNRQGSSTFALTGINCFDTDGGEI